MMTIHKCTHTLTQSRARVLVGGTAKTARQGRQRTAARGASTSAKAACAFSHTAMSCCCCVEDTHNALKVSASSRPRTEGSCTRGRSPCPPAAGARRSRCRRPHPHSHHTGMHHTESHLGHSPTSFACYYLPGKGSGDSRNTGPGTTTPCPRREPHIGPLNQSDKTQNKMTKTRLI